MTTFQVMSDLHLEFYNITEALEKIELLPVTSEILILAGDIHNKYITRVLEEFSKKWRLILYVPGNHEYYGERFKYQFERFANLKKENIKILLNDLYIDPVSKLRFAGTTLWFPSNEDTLSNQHRLNDFTRIKESHKIFDFNANAQKFLKYSLYDNDLADIVITHHAPTQLSIAKEFEGDPVNCYYYTPILDNMYEYCNAKIWIHGHTHVVNDFIHPSGVRIISNCAGYNWDVEGWKPERVYEISENSNHS
jgi:predicted phosphodiesterase